MKALQASGIQNTGCVHTLGPRRVRRFFALVACGKEEYFNTWNSAYSNQWVPGVFVNGKLMTTDQFASMSQSTVDAGVMISTFVGNAALALSCALVLENVVANVLPDLQMHPRSAKEIKTALSSAFARDFDNEFSAVYRIIGYGDGQGLADFPGLTQGQFQFADGSMVQVASGQMTTIRNGALSYDQTHLNGRQIEVADNGQISVNVQ